MYVHIQLQVVHFTQPPLPHYCKHIVHYALRLAVCESSPQGPLILILVASR